MGAGDLACVVGWEVAFVAGWEVAFVAGWEVAFWREERRGGAPKERE